MRIIADNYIEKGLNKGIEQRNVEIACHIPKKNTDIKFISSVTDLYY